MHSGIRQIFTVSWLIKSTTSGDFPGGPEAKTPNAEDLGSTPGQKTRSLMQQMRSPNAAIKDP